MKKKRAVFIAIALAAPLLLLVLLDATDRPEELTVEIIDYTHVKSGNVSSITLAVTNHFYFKSQRIAFIEIEQAASSYTTSLHSDVTLASQNGEHIKALSPEKRGRWRVLVLVCPYWRERLDNSFTRKLHWPFLWATYRETRSDWIDD